MEKIKDIVRNQSINFVPDTLDQEIWPSIEKKIDDKMRN